MVSGGMHEGTDECMDGCREGIGHSASSGPGGNREAIDTGKDKSETVHITRLLSVILVRYLHRMRLFWSHTALNHDLGCQIAKRMKIRQQKIGKHTGLTTEFRCAFEFWPHMTRINENP